VDMPCKWCNHQEICHLKGLPIVGCRTCAHATPTTCGKWVCEKKAIVVDMACQEVGCDQHIFIPQMVPLDQTDSDPEKGTVSYGQIVNGPGAIASRDIQATVDRLCSGEVEI